MFPGSGRLFLRHFGVTRRYVGLGWQELMPFRVHLTRSAYVT